MADTVPDQERLKDEQYGDAARRGGAAAHPDTPIETLAEAISPPEDRDPAPRRRVGHPGDALGDAHRVRRPPALGARPAALSETTESLAATLAEGAGFLVLVGDEPAATMVTTRVDGVLRLSRVAVHPRFQRHGIATFAVGALLEALSEAGEESITLLSRREYPQLEQWWAVHGFARVAAQDDCWVLARRLPVVVEVPTADEMRELGRGIASLVRPGDLITATGDLGAGKTTFAQGLAEGMGVAGAVISPTFVISRVHRSPDGGPALVHVDAYRLSSAAELEDIDLEESLHDSVTLIEWGQGVSESLNPNRLEIEIRRTDDAGDETRWVYLTPVGERWDRAELAAAVGAVVGAVVGKEST